MYSVLHSVEDSLVIVLPSKLREQVIQYECKIKWNQTHQMATLIFTNYLNYAVVAKVGTKFPVDGTMITYTATTVHNETWQLHP